MKYNKEQIEWLKINYPKGNIEECAKYLNCTVKALFHVTHRNGIKRDINFNYKNLNKKIFSLKNPKFIYLLGYLWADGHLTNDLSCSLHIQLEDGKEIENIIDDLNIFKKRLYNKVNRKSSIEFYTRNIDFCNLLNKYRYQEKSFVSPILLLQDIPENLWYLWWRGFLDGDGSISIINQSQGREYKTCLLAFYSSFNQDWSFLKYLKNKVNFSFKYKQRIRVTGKCSEILIKKRKDILSICDYIYKNFNKQKIGLKRKYNKFLLIKEYNKKYQ